MAFEVPGWLQGNNDHDAETPSSSSSPFAPPPPMGGSATRKSATMGAVAADDDPGVSSMLMVQDDGQPPPREPSILKRLCQKLLYVVSVAFLGLFVYALVDSLDDDSSNRLLWLLYYAACAGVAFLFLVALWCGRLNPAVDKIVLTSAVLALGFTGYMLWQSITDYQDASSADNDGDDKDDAFEKVIGAAIGGFSNLYHLIFWFFVRNPISNKKRSSSGDDDLELDDVDDLKV